LVERLSQRRTKPLSELNFKPQTEYFCQAWGLTLLEPVYPRSYHWVCPVLGPQGQAWVLKLRPPDRACRSEIKTLQDYAGNGSVALVRGDSERGALLLERLEPGSLLSACVEEAESVSITAQVMQQLWQNPPSDQPLLSEWARDFQRLGPACPLPQESWREAEALYWKLCQNAERQVLLHADLHQDNILAVAENRYLAIDPHGRIGDPAFEPAAFLRNYLMTHSNPLALLKERIAIFSRELALPAERIACWGYAQTVLSALWLWEDHGSGMEKELEIAALLRQVWQLLST
jgi:streptomycin 6-kinase